MPPRKKQTTTESDITAANEFRNNDRYDKLVDFAPGGESQCSLLRSHTTGKLVVIKTTTAWRKLTSSSANKQPVLCDEARLLTHIIRPHPNIIRLFGTDLLSSGRCNMYLEYCNGGDLLEYCNGFREAKGFTPEAFTLHLFSSLASSLAFLHYGYRFDDTSKQWSQDANHTAVQHQDLKPDNILLHFDSSCKAGLPRVVCADFGLASTVRDSRGVIGTPDYEAPEVMSVYALRTTDPVRYRQKQNTLGIQTRKSDIFSFGLVIFTVANLKRLKPTALGVPPSLIRVPAGYRTQELATAIEWCLRLAPKDRAEMTFDQNKGLLPFVERFGRIRDQLLEAESPLLSSDWKMPPSVTLH